VTIPFVIAMPRHSAKHPIERRNERPVILLARSAKACDCQQCLALALALQIFSRPHSTSTQGKRWYKGNTHTHTVNSDGDSTPDEVVRWYREHGYNFLVLSDHNYLTEVDGLNAVFGAQGKFIVIRGEEVSDKFQEKPIHLNGLNIKQVVEPQGGASVSGVIQNNVNAIRKVEGAPHVNHPNFHWAVGANDLKTIKNLRLFEVYNGHPEVNNLGGGGMPGLEAMWDDILSAGMVLYGQQNPNYFAKVATQYKNTDLSGNPMNGIWIERTLTSNNGSNTNYGGAFPNTGKLTPPTSNLWIRTSFDGTNVITEYCFF